MGGQKCSEKNSDTILNWKQDGMIPRSRGELEVCQASGVLQASENFLSFCCLPGWSLAELGRGEKSSFSALRGAEEQVWS
jgi:hypothetical protein